MKNNINKFNEELLPENEIFATLDLISEENLLGSELTIGQLIEGQLSIGKWHIIYLPSNDENQSNKVLNHDRDKYDFYLVDLPFTLEEMSGDRYYKQIKLKVELDNTNVTAYQLLPSNTFIKNSVTETSKFSPGVSVKGIMFTLGGKDKQISFEYSIPIITTYGLGESNFSWLYQSQNDEQIFPGSKQLSVILEVPKHIRSVKGRVSFDVVISKNILGVWTIKNIKTGECTVEWYFNNNFDDEFKRIMELTAFLDSENTNGGSLPDLSQEEVSQNPNMEVVQEIKGMPEDELKECNHLAQRAEANLKLKQYHDALQDATEILKRAMIIRANAYLSLKCYYEAIQNATEVLKIDPVNIMALRIRADAYSWLRQFDITIHDASEALKIDPQNPSILSIRADAYRCCSRYDDAKRDVCFALSLDPRNIFALTVRAKIYLNLNQFEDSILDATQALKIEPQNIYAMTIRAEAHRSLGRYKEAIEDTTNALKIDSRFYLALMVRSETYRRTGMLKEAFEDAARAEKIEKMLL